MRHSVLIFGTTTVFIILIYVKQIHHKFDESLIETQNEKNDILGVPFDSAQIAIHFTNVSILKGNGTYKLNRPSGKNKNMLTWSQYGQDAFIDHMLLHKRNGFFVEIGGFDGETHSNTLLFEKQRNWSGLLVEANPYTFQSMVEKDRSCYMFNACISNNVPNMTFIVGGALTSVNNITTSKHKRRIDHDAVLYKGSKNWRHAKEHVVINCYSLISILKSIGRTHINYFSLDVEGAELIILNSIDWNQIKIDTFTIETDQNRKEILSFMKKHGYKWVKKLSGDDVFIKQQ